MKIQVKAIATSIKKRCVRAWRRHRRKCAWGLLELAALTALTLAWPMDVQYYLRTRPAGEMLDRHGRPLYAFLNPAEQWCFPRELDQISPWLLQATIAAEDQRFRQHWGVDPWAILRAASQNLRGRRVVSGASTLTMQVVKLSGAPSDSLPGKLRQAVQAVRLDLHAKKDELLAAYLNAAPYGLNLVGCEAAARRFFGKPARELTLAEAATLAGLPRAPTSLNPIKFPERARERRDYVLRRMHEEGMISAERCRRALETELGAKWGDFAQHAPHLAMEVKPLFAARSQVRTTLNLDVQKMVERLVRLELQNPLYWREITNAAAIVVDTSSAAVLARVGSADFYQTPGGGQVDACRAERSPGSTLKPFTYALALDEQRLYPGEVLLDNSLDYGLYDPVNFDGLYHGLVSAEDALKFSLNVPAVTVLHRIGWDRAYAFLHDAGFSTLNRPAEHYGLGLTLGNCGAKLEELAAVYTMLANLGEYRPLRMIAREKVGNEAPPDRARRLLTRGACLSLYQMLEQPLPGERDLEDLGIAQLPTRVCWKTGTSTGHHDAWTFVFNRHYVVGVWLGNNDNKPSRRLIGAEAALPLAAKIFRALPPKSEAAWPRPEGELREATVCAVSGLPESRWCRHTRTVHLARSQYLHRRCDVHRPARNSDAAANGSAEQSIVERWPAGAQGWDLAHVQVATPAPTAQRAAEKPREEAFHILSPANSAEYVLTHESNADRLRLRASREDEETLHWYLNDRYLGSSAPHAPLFLELRPGAHALSCMASGGAIDKVQFSVQEPTGHITFDN